MLVEVLLFPHNSGLLDLERLSILELYLRSLLKNHVDYSVKIVVDLSHDFHLTLLHLLTQLSALGDQEFCATTQRLQVLNYLVSVLLQDVN